MSRKILVWAADWGALECWLQQEQQHSASETKLLAIRLPEAEKRRSGLQFDLAFQLLLAHPEPFFRLRKLSLSLSQLLPDLVPLPDCLFNLLLGSFDRRDCLFVGLKHE